MNRSQIKLAIIALVMGASSAFAFKSSAVHKSGKQSLVWFSYNGMGATDPSNYTKISGTPDCNSGSILCAIEGPDQGGDNPSQATVDHPTLKRNRPN